MKITKLGHCCLLIEDNGVRILTDPGNLSTAQNELTDLDAIVITHEHGDHLHIDSLKQILINNPEVPVFVNKAVAGILDSDGIPHTLVDDKGKVTIKGFPIEAFEMPHALIHSSLPQVLNTGFLFNEALFYPGDAYIKPGKPVEILALPVAGPWAKSADYIDYLLEIAPKKAFPVHDGVLKSAAMLHQIISGVAKQHDIKFIPLEEGGILDL